MLVLFRGRACSARNEKEFCWQKSLLAMTVAPMFLSGCGIIGACSNKCEAPLVHDSFCGCQDWRGLGETTPNGTNTDRADCICQYKNGVIGAWFAYRPPNYGVVNRSLPVLAVGCSDQNVCLEDAGEGRTEGRVLTGRMTIEPTNWHQSTNLLNGQSVYILYGKPKIDRSEIDLPHTQLPIHALARLGRMLRNIQPANINNTPENCRAACDAGSPFCITARIGASQSLALSRLYKSLVAKPEAIRSADLMSIFDIDADPCRRSDTSLKDDVLENKGDACELRTDGGISGLNAKIDVPAILTGRVLVDGPLFKAEFPYTETRAALRFVDRTGNPDQEIDPEWGGEIKAIYADGTTAGFSVGSTSCVRVRTP